MGVPRAPGLAALAALALLLVFGLVALGAGTGTASAGEAWTAPPGVAVALVAGAAGSRFPCRAAMAPRPRPPGRRAH